MEGGRRPAGARRGHAGALPPGLLEDILARVPGRDARAARRVCRAWREAMLAAGVLLVDVTSSVERLRRARGQGISWGTHICAGAARMGRLKILQEARRLGCPWDADTCAGAAEGGHLKVLEWARGQGCEWDARTWQLAAGGGHRELLAWAEAQNCPRVLDVIVWEGPGSLVLWQQRVLDIVPRVLDIVPWVGPGSLVPWTGAAPPAGGRRGDPGPRWGGEIRGRACVRALPAPPGAPRAPRAAPAALAPPPARLRLGPPARPRPHTKP